MKIRMRFGEVICTIAESANNLQEKLTATECEVGMWKCSYQEMFVKYCKWFGWQQQQESKKAEVDNSKKFKAVLQKCLRENSFYSLDEYLELHS